jgi:hypothetical protein
MRSITASPQSPHGYSGYISVGNTGPEKSTLLVESDGYTTSTSVEVIFDETCASDTVPETQCQN